MTSIVTFELEMIQQGNDVILSGCGGFCGLGSDAVQMRELVRHTALNFRSVTREYLDGNMASRSAESGVSLAN